jgi:hypothetical protein
MKEEEKIDLAVFHFQQFLLPWQILPVSIQSLSLVFSLSSRSKHPSAIKARPIIIIIYM